MHTSRTLTNAAVASILVSLLISSFAVRATKHDAGEDAAASVELTVWQHAYRGDINGKAVQVQSLHRIGDRIEGSYCYRACTSTSSSLRLEGIAKDDGLQLDESEPVADSQSRVAKSRITGHWRLQPDGDGWRGEWRSPDGSRRLPVQLHAQSDSPRFPYELRLNAAFVPGTDEDNCDAQSPTVDAIRIYRDNKLVQELTTGSTGTCGMFLPEIVDMNFDGWPDLTLAQTLPAGPNIPHQSWLFDPKTQRFVDAPDSLQELTSPEFDAKHGIVYHFWRGSCCSHGVETYRWKSGDLVALGSEESHFMPVRRQGKIHYLYSVPMYEDGHIVFSPRVVRDRNGGLHLEPMEGIDSKANDIDDDSPPAWSEALAVDVYKQRSDGSFALESSQHMRWRRVIKSDPKRWCPELAVYDIDKQRVDRQRIDDPDLCTDTDPNSDASSDHLPDAAQ